MAEGYAICFNSWIFDTRIKNELNLLLLISSYTAERGYCFASNKHFAELFNVDEATISRKISKLAELGYISIEYIKRGAEVVERKIRLTKISTDDLQKCQPTIDEKVKENNTSNNITRKEKEKEKEKDDPKPPLPDGGQADFVSFEEQRKKDYELAELTKKKIQADLIKKFGV